MSDISEAHACNMTVAAENSEVVQADELRYLTANGGRSGRTRHCDAMHVRGVSDGDDLLSRRSF